MDSVFFATHLLKSALPIENGTVNSPVNRLPLPVILTFAVFVPVAMLSLHSSETFSVSSAEPPMSECSPPFGSTKMISGTGFFSVPSYVCTGIVTLNLPASYTVCRSAGTMLNFAVNFSPGAAVLRVIISSSSPAVWTPDDDCTYVKSVPGTNVYVRSLPSESVDVYVNVGSAAIRSQLNVWSGIGAMSIFVLSIGTIL